MKQSHLCMCQVRQYQIDRPTHKYQRQHNTQVYYKVTNS